MLSTERLLAGLMGQKTDSILLGCGCSSSLHALLTCGHAGDPTRWAWRPAVETVVRGEDGGPSLVEENSLRQFLCTFLLLPHPILLSPHGSKIE